MNVRALLLLSSLLLPACAASSEEVDSTEEAASAGPPTVLVDTTGESTKVRAGGLTVWVDNVARVAGDTMTVRLRTSRSLANAMSWVPDDGFGDARIVSPQVVEIDLRGGHEMNTMLSGLPLFVHLSTKTGDVRDYDVRLDLAPRFGRFQGSSSIFVHQGIRPVWVNGDLAYRGKASAPAALTVSGNPLVTRTGNDFQIDWRYDQLVFGSPVTFTAQSKTKRAEMEAYVARVGLTKEGADRVWPPAACKPAVRSCVVASTTDRGHCGTYREVTRCIDAISCQHAAYDRASTGFEAIKSAYNAACPRGGSWCSVSELRAFDVGGCDDAPAIDQVAGAIDAVMPDRIGYQAPVTLTRAELLTRRTFSAHGGPQMLAAIDAYVGTTNVIAKEYVTDVPCHNCTERALRYILYYVDSQAVIVVEATDGYDS
jgi:hypothetical protein